MWCFSCTCTMQSSCIYTCILVSCILRRYSVRSQKVFRTHSDINSDFVVRLCSDGFQICKPQQCIKESRQTSSQSPLPAFPNVQKKKRNLAVRPGNYFSCNREHHKPRTYTLFPLKSRQSSVVYATQLTSRLALTADIRVYGTQAVWRGAKRVCGGSVMCC